MNGGNGCVAPTATPTKHSMLDKLKLFNKEKPDRSSKTQISKRTSSSSGFSSARSERSDSSLSLNNDQTTKTSGIPVSQPVSAASTQQQQQQTKDAKKSDNSAAASKTKSKLLLSSSSKGSNKDTLTKSKSDKKDKSPARMSADMSESKIAVPKVQKSASSKNESKLKLISSSRKSLTEQTAASKVSGISQIPPPSSSSSMSSSTSSAIGKAQTSSSMQQQQQPQMVNQTSNVVTTSIPKPMAAIKGQTKLSNAHNQMNAQKTNEQYTDIKCQKLVDISSQNNNNNHNNTNNNNNNNISTANQDEGRMQIIAPILIENAVVVNQHQQHQVVLANHLQMQQALNQQNISMSDSCHSKSTMNSSSTTTTTTGPITNSCDSSSGIIYASLMHRPGTVLSPSNKLILANRARQHATDRYGNMHQDHQGSMIKASSNGSIASSASSSMTAMSSSNSSGPNGGSNSSSSTTNKFHTVPTKQMVNGVIYEEEKMTVVPMRPLLRGYNSHLTLPTRGNRNQNIAYGDYNDDMAQGYCSDGDALRKTPVRYSDIENGYMSEGGGATNTTTNGNVLHQKPMLLRARTQLPTTMEER